MIPCWHDGNLTALPISLSGPLAWSVDIGGKAAAQALATVPARADDLTDAAGRSDGTISLIRRRLARALVARLAKCHPDLVYIGRSADGAPSVITPHEWYLSISGRGQRCLIGVARVPIGVDMELVGNADLLKDPLWDMVTSAEANALRIVQAPKRNLEWLRRWTAKEAHAKLIGSPRRIDPASIETTLWGRDNILCDFEGRSLCWNRRTNQGMETLAIWSLRS